MSSYLITKMEFNYLTLFCSKMLCQISNGKFNLRHYVIGGYGFVFVAQDTSTGKEYALKVKFNFLLLFIDYFCFLSVINEKITSSIAGGIISFHEKV